MHGENNTIFDAFATRRIAADGPNALPLTKGEQLMVKVALLVRLEAKPGKETAAHSSRGRTATRHQETTTPYGSPSDWGRPRSGFCDAFRDEAARKAHLAGPIAAALMANATSYSLSLRRSSKSSYWR